VKRDPTRYCEVEQEYFPASEFAFDTACWWHVANAGKGNEDRHLAANEEDTLFAAQIDPTQ
jgi:hypothetical protein